VNRRGANSFWVERAQSVDGVNTGTPNSGAFSTVGINLITLRVAYDANQQSLSQHYSLDNGVTWTRVSAPITGGFGAGGVAKVGAIAMGGGSTTGTAVAHFTKFSLESSGCVAIEPPELT